MANRFDVALVSGGKDSTAAAHYAHENHGMDVLVYLDTRTGAQKNREYIEELADELGLQLWTLRSHVDFEERVREHGFPGPSRHFIMYRSLKERQIGKMATAVNGDLHLWTGVRRHESDRRLNHVEDEKEAQRWTWHAPIASWRREAVRQYIEEHDLPQSPLWETLGRSADCWCGCFGNPEELIDAEACGLDDVVEQMRGLEEDVEFDDEKGRWGWGGMSEHEQRAERAEGRDMMLCADCEHSVFDETGENDG